MKPNLHARILAEIPEHAFVLDIGAGLGSYHDALVDRATVTMLDAYEPSLEDRRRRFKERAYYVQAEALNYVMELPWQAFDVVLGIDVVEHLNRADALRLLGEMRRVGRKVVLFIPEGSHPQGPHSGNPWQEHKSSWQAQDLIGLGFKVEVWPEFHNEPGKDPGAMFVTWSAE